MRMNIVLIGVFIGLFLSSSSSLASDQCFDFISVKYETDAKASNEWGFEGLQSLTQSEAIDMLESALSDMNSPESLANAKVLAQQKDKLFYNLLWNAPSNTGNSVIIVNEKNCEVLADVGIWSEE